MEGDDFGPAKPNVLKEKLTWLSSKSFNIIKLFLGVGILPFAFAVTVSFLNELHALPAKYQMRLWQGVVGLLILHLFVWEPAFIYSRGQKLLELVFQFIKPLVKVAPYLFPIYAALLFAAYWPVQHFRQDALEWFTVCFGALMAMHLIFGAKSLRGKKGDFLKSNYVFGFSFVYIFNLVFAGFCFNAIFEKYSLVRFLSGAYTTASGIFAAVFKQLFVAG
jgi:hypothetical protein